MSASVKRARKEQVAVRTSKDGRLYVTTTDVLNSDAGREEIRKQAETFRLMEESSKTNGPANSNEAPTSGEAATTPKIYTTTKK